MSLSKQFCWTRFGTEAGEPIETILARKEEERAVNGSIFLWGVGNGIKPSMQALIRHEPEPEIIFSPIRSAPRKADVAPSKVVMWMAARTMNDNHYDLPEGSLVTSRFSRRPHYALVCASDVPLEPDFDGERFSFGALRNLLTGKPVGVSQVTAVVRHVGGALRETGPIYVAALRARLVPPYFVRLVEPHQISNWSTPSEIGAVRKLELNRILGGWATSDSNSEPLMRKLART